MVNILQIVISRIYSDQFVHSLIPKSVAVIGAGSAGLAMLKAPFDLPETTRDGWRIVLYEQRGDVGGVWQETALFSPPKSNVYQASRSPFTFTTYHTRVPALPTSPHEYPPFLPCLIQAFLSLPAFYFISATSTSGSITSDMPWLTI